MYINIKKGYPFIRKKLKNIQFLKNSKSYIERISNYNNN